MTHWKKLTNPNYLGAYSLEDGKDIILTIKKVSKEPVIGADGKSEDCIVCYFAENVKPMILNSTNCKTISKVTGTPYIEEWAGNRIQIGIERVKAFGDVVDALRVKKNKPKQTSSGPIYCEECGAEIAPVGNYAAEDVARINLKRYGKAICADCSKKMNENKEAADNAE